MSRFTAGFLRWRWVGAGLLAIVVVVGVCEAKGWPFLASPMQRWLGDALDRRVSFGADAAQPSAVTIHLLGGIAIAADFIEIGAPPWSKAPHMLLARDAKMTLGYADLVRAAFGRPLRIRELHASHLEGNLERLADGRASWQFGKHSDVPDTAEHPTLVPEFGRLQVDSGSMSYRDALMDVTLDSTFALVDSTNVRAPTAISSASAPGFQLSGKGTYQKQPLHVDLQTSGVLTLVADDVASMAMPVMLNARIGSASMTFQGTAVDALHLSDVKGRFTVQGPSLAAVGDPVRITLPTTGPFKATGLVSRQGRLWYAVIDRADIGASRVAGAFTYDARRNTPVLAGRLTGTRLALADLGPAVGTSNGDVAAAPGHVIPNREFDLPALRAMDANVLIDIDDLDLGSSFLQPLKPLRTHLVLSGGVLTLQEFDARTGQGRLFGTVQLDGRNAQALWTADLRWDGVRLESWIRQARGDGAPPYATGSLSGQARVAGQGKSTAAILGSLRGGVRMQLQDGTISHLAVEAAGLDIAQGLGVMIKGDDALPIQCTVVDLVADQGLLRPRVLVLDTRDSTLWIDGSLSLATEAMDLRVVVTPKDFSPLALRTPVRLRGTFAKPSFSLEPGRLGTRVGAAALLALVNPLAALIPFIDTGSSADAKRGADACRALAQRIAASPSLPSPDAAASAGGSRKASTTASASAR